MADKNEELVLSIRGMSKSFGRNRVLDHIDLDLKPGTVMGLMGENGAEDIKKAIHYLRFILAADYGEKL